MTAPSDSDLEALAVLEDQEAAGAAKRAATIRAFKSGSTPTPPPASTGFTGLTLGDTNVWNQAPVFKDDLSGDLSNFSMYPKGWKDTSGKGTYDPANASIFNRSDGVRALRQIVKAGAAGVFGGCVAQPMWGGGVGYIDSYRLSVRRKLEQQDHGHDVLLGWPAKDSDWPTKSGEPDDVENSTMNNPTIGGYLHVKGATSGSDHQVALPSNVKAYDAFHVITIENIAGKSYRRYIDNVLTNVVLTAGQTPTAADKACPNLTVLASGYSVPDELLRICLQLESDGTSPTKQTIVDTDWVVVQPLKAAA